MNMTSTSSLLRSIRRHRLGWFARFGVFSLRSVKQLSSTAGSFHKEIAEGDLPSWTPESRKVYLAQAERLLPQGWELAGDSVFRDDEFHRNESFTNWPPDSGALFTWVMFVHRDKMKSLSIWQFGPRLEVVPGVLHGGMVSTALDDALARHIYLALNEPAIATSTLTVNYFRFVPIHKTVIIDGRIDRKEGLEYHSSGTMRSPENDVTYSNATVVYFTVPPRSPI